VWVCGVWLEFLRTKDREQEIGDQEKGDDSHDVIGHKMIMADGIRLCRRSTRRGS
jgi:hypothetical protein